MSSSVVEQEQQQQQGILNRCPWPFIFFHDIKQAMKDTPTWIVITWAFLKLASKKVVASQ